MKILLTGSSGLIGQALTPSLTADGHQLTRLVRSKTPAGSEQIFWDPEAGALQPEALEGFDAVVHLAGESIVGRWTAGKKSRILASRAQGTRLLSESLARLKQPPRVLVSASAIGYYGDRGDQPLDENSSAGSLFLSQVTTAWEVATEPAARIPASGWSICAWDSSSVRWGAGWRRCCFPSEWGWADASEADVSI